MTTLLFASTPVAISIGNKTSFLRNHATFALSGKHLHSNQRILLTILFLVFFALATTSNTYAPLHLNLNLYDSSKLFQELFAFSASQDQRFISKIFAELRHLY